MLQSKNWCRSFHLLKKQEPAFDPSIFDAEVLLHPQPVGRAGVEPGFLGSQTLAMGAVHASVPPL